MSNKVHVKTGDTVVVINGKNRGAKQKNGKYSCYFYTLHISFIPFTGF